MPLKMRILRVLKDFARTSSIHGLWYIVRPNGTTRSKIGFALVVLGAALYASLEIRNSVVCKFLLTHNTYTLESGIDIGQGITVGPGQFFKTNKRRA